MTDRRLLETAAETMENSYTPYSLTKTGAALETIDGTVFTGCTIENIALGTTICAEAAAIAAAVSAGHREFKRLAIISEGNTYRFPCGTCRQLLSEFAKDLEVLCARTSDGRFVSYAFTALFPMSLEREQ